tara:strand:+ start:5071 stop:5688 length:618 start_codon:yes stop_codon:yes gene_type:complete
MKFFFTLLSRFLNYLVKPSEKASIVISSKQEIELEAETNLDNNIENVFSQFFTLEEVTRSETAIRNNIDNTPNHDQILQLQQLCSAILDRIREHYDKPIRILSGYRCEKLNKKIGGSKNSQHQALENNAAIDFEFYDHGVNLETIFHWITQLSNLQFDQCIAEFLPEGWIHISYKPGGKNRGKITRAVKINNQTKYEQLGTADWM